MSGFLEHADPQPTQVGVSNKRRIRLEPQYLEVREDVDARLVDEMEKRKSEASSTLSQVFDHVKAGVDAVSGLGSDTVDAGKHVASAITSRVRKLSLSMTDSVKQTAMDTAHWVSNNMSGKSDPSDRKRSASEDGEKLSVVIHHSLHGEKWSPDEPKTYSASDRVQDRIARRKSSEDKPESRLFVASTGGIIEAILPQEETLKRDRQNVMSDEGFSEAPAGEYQDDGEDAELSSIPRAPTSSPNPAEFIPQRFTANCPSNLIHPRPVVSGCCLDPDQRERMQEMSDWFSKNETDNLSQLEDRQTGHFMPAPQHPASLTSSTVSVAGSTSSGTSPQPHQKDCRTMLRQDDHMWGVGHSGNQFGPID